MAGGVRGFLQGVGLSRFYAACCAAMLLVSLAPSRANPNHGTAKRTGIEAQPTGPYLTHTAGGISFPATLVQQNLQHRLDMDSHPALMLHALMLLAVSLGSGLPAPGSEPVQCGVMLPAAVVSIPVPGANCM